jgi:hypothetical protein
VTREGDGTKSTLPCVFLNAHPGAVVFSDRHPGAVVLSDRHPGAVVLSHL